MQTEVTIYLKGGRSFTVLCQSFQVIYKPDKTVEKIKWVNVSDDSGLIYLDFDEVVAIVTWPRLSA